MKSDREDAVVEAFCVLRTTRTVLDRLRPSKTVCKDRAISRKLRAIAPPPLRVDVLKCG